MAAERRVVRLDPRHRVPDPVGARLAGTLCRIREPPCFASEPVGSREFVFEELQLLSSSRLPLVVAAGFGLLDGAPELFHPPAVGGAGGRVDGYARVGHNRPAGCRRRQVEGVELAPRVSEERGMNPSPRLSGNRTACPSYHRVHTSPSRAID